MPDDDARDRDTLIECPACGGDLRRECELCGGTGCVRPAVAAGWLFNKARERFTSRELAAIGITPSSMGLPRKPGPR